MLGWSASREGVGSKMTQRGLWSVGLAGLLVLGGCGEDSKSGQSAYWQEWCDRLDCDPNSPEWQNGLVNGHKVRPVETCAPSTDYPGDDMALCPPEDGDGFQLHFGPSSYDDADEMSRFIADPLEEIEECQYVRMPNAEIAYVNQFSGNMRPQSHHMILWGPVGEDHPEGLSNCDAAAGLASGFLLGSQTQTISLPDLNAPTLPGEESTVNQVDPDMLVALDLHYVNRSREPILRESWVNMYTTELTDEVKILNPIFLAGSNINVPPMSTGTKFHYACPAPVDMRINLLTGHHHANSPRFSIWVQRAGSDTQELVYENRDALDPFMATYVDGYALPTPDAENNISGGRGGALSLAAGDKLHWECEFDNPTSTTVRLGETSTDQMCNVFGSFITEGEVGTWNAAGFGNTCIGSDILGNVGVGASP